jgi:hypothetical protein
MTGAPSEARSDGRLANGSVDGSDGALGVLGFALAVSLDSFLGIGEKGFTRGSPGLRVKEVLGLLWHRASMEPTVGSCMGLRHAAGPGWPSSKLSARFGVHLEGWAGER